MKTPTRRRLVAAVILTAISAVATAGAVAAFNPQPEPPGSPVLGFTDEQALSLTAVNLAARGHCEVQFEYVAADGTTLASETMRVEPGTFASLELHPPDPIIPPDPIFPPDPVRLQARGVVTPLTSRCELATTLEIFDTADGRTTAAIAETAVADQG